MPEQEEAFCGPCIVELMGHRRLAGHVSEQVIAGAAFIRIDVPDSADEIVATQFYSPQAVYCITPTTPDMVRRMAPSNEVQPVQQWELPAPVASSGPRVREGYPKEDEPEEYDDDLDDEEESGEIDPEDRDG